MGYVPNSDGKEVMNKWVMRKRGCRCSKQNLVVVLAVLQLLRRLCSVVSPWREVTHSFLTGLQSKVSQFAEHKNNARLLYPKSFCLPAKATYRKGEYLKRSQWFQAGSTFPVPQMHRCLIFGHGNGCLITSENSSLWCHGYLLAVLLWVCGGTAQVITSSGKWIFYWMFTVCKVL